MKAILKKISAVRPGFNSVPVALLALCFLAYGILINRLGFYWDDWPNFWMPQVLGDMALVEAFSIYRPFIGPLFAITNPLGGETTLQWQVFGILSRWLAVVAFWWALQKVWPSRRREVTWVAMAFSVYPGFGQQWVAIIYGRWFILLSIFFFSLGATVWALRSPQRSKILVPVSLLTAAYPLFALEYIFGMELLRPLIIWFVLGERGEGLAQRLKNTLKRWLPYLVVWFSYTIWRAFIFRSALYDFQFTRNITSDPFGTVLNLAKVEAQAVVDTLVRAWTGTFQLFSVPFNEEPALFSPLVVVLCLLFVVVYLALLDYDRSRKSDGLEDEETPADGGGWGVKAMLLGIFGIVLGVIPPWSAGLPIRLHFMWDRFFFSFMAGASLFLVGFLEYIIKTQRQRLVVLGLLISLATGHHYRTAVSFQRAWDAQKEFFWQLTWRIPAMEPGTTLMTHEIELDYYSDMSLVAPLNMIYAPDNDTRELSYMLLYQDAPWWLA